MTPMPKPFIILALPRTGTRMLCSALSSHPDIPNVSHEFKGDKEAFIERRYVLSNYVRPWMHDVDANMLHVYREDSMAGGLSMMMMSYNFPDNVVHVPFDEVRYMADKRERWDAEMREVADCSISYETLTGGEEVADLGEANSEFLCSVLDLSPHLFVTGVRKGRKIIPKNFEELQCRHA